MYMTQLVKMDLWEKIFQTKNHFKTKNQNILFSLNIKNIKIHSKTIKHQNLRVNSYMYTLEDKHKN